MSDRPTPETDAIEKGMFGSDATLIADFARRLERERDDLLDRLTTLEHSMPVELANIERERDEALDAAEKAKAYKRVIKEDNAKLRRELDELNKRLIEASQVGIELLMQRDDLRKELSALKEARNGSKR